MSSIEVEKILVVQDPLHFYRILADFNHWTGGVDDFLRAYFRWEGGCPCHGEKLWSEVIEKYRDLVLVDLTPLYKKIGCTKIEFK